MDSQPKRRSRRYADRRRARIDGTGAPPVERDVAVRDGRIVAIGDRANWAGAEEVIEAEGRALAPGFIDVHTHDDTHVIRSPQMLPKITQGVTTVIVGNCGISASPVTLKGEPPDPMNLLGERDAFQYPTFADYVEAVNAARPAVNVGALIGHTALRNNQMDRLDRAATPQEIDGMRAQLEEALAQRRARLEQRTRLRLGVQRAAGRSDGAGRTARRRRARSTRRTCAPNSTRFSTRWTRRIGSAVMRACRW